MKATIDQKYAQQARQLLSTFIGMMMEDASDTALRVGRRSSAHGELLQLGQDVTALAIAMEVIHRRGRQSR